jgi:hypothetical protein
MTTISTHAAGDVPDTGSGRKLLGTLLVDAGFITEAQLEEALNDGAATGLRLGEVVVRRGWATEDDVAKLLAEQWELGYVERSSIFFDSDALGRLTREQAQRLEALPTRVQDGQVVVAVAEPTEERLAALRAVIGPDTVVVVVPKTALDAGLRSELLSGEPAERSKGGAGAAGERTAAAAPPPDIAAERMAPAAGAVEPARARVLAALESTAAEAAVLGAGVAALSELLAELVQQAEAAAARFREAGADFR